MAIQNYTVGLLGNYNYSQASIEAAYCSEANPNAPLDNFLDARPNRPVILRETSIAQKTIAWSVDPNIFGSSLFDPEILVLANVHDMKNSPSSRFTQSPFDITIQNAAALGVWTTIVAATTITPGVAVGSDLLFDFSGVASATRKRRYWRIIIETDDYFTNKFMVGAGLLGKKYLFPSTLASGMRVGITNINSTVGRTAGSGLTYRSYQPARTLSASFRMTSNSDRDTFINYLRGHPGGAYPQRYVDFHRLNWITAIVPPTDWQSATVGYPIVGSFVSVDVETLLDGIHVARFDFREIPAENA